ncbi:hypothetical protein [Caldisalinibacter kiritimatiensis]|uniref:Uncharacterized protein n=1 Tax=Caldisalinibacter kiritimatiensis TaxID=1304284 RepID=R1CKZ1_9FIRM|nr:hypothetical protein [Caldisalinibacter kiritimatiensis]EOC99380.1 hypothetical protein L21TH_2638 [Caldisalinibacter kiritimatiensis]
MKRYIKLGFMSVMLLAVVLLVGCGAEISSQISLNEDGSGERIIYAYVDDENISEIDGGIEKLDEVLNAAKPSTLELKKTNVESGVIYEMKYDFNNIEEYNKKTSELIGTEHNATYTWNKSLFGFKSSFNEPDVLYELVKWAIDAVEQSGIVNSSRNDLYELETTTVDIGIDSVSFNSGYGDISYEYEDTYPIKRIDVETHINFDENIKRELRVAFEKSIVEIIGEDEIKKYLNNFYNGFTKEEKDGTVIYKVTLTPQTEDEMASLMSPVTNETDCFLEVNEGENSNVLHKLYNIKENFNFNELIKGTYVSNNIHYTLHLPQGYEIDCHSSNGYIYQNEEVDGERIIATEYYQDEDLDLSLTMEREYYVDNIEVVVDIKDSKLAEKKVSYILSRETAEDVGLDALEDYFKTINEDINIIESGAKVIYEDTIEISGDTKQKEEHLLKYDSLMYYKKSDISNIKKDVYAFYDNSTFNKILGGLRVNNNITYTINIPNKYNILYLEKNGDEINIDTNETEERENQQITFNLGDNNNIEIKLTLMKNSNLPLLIIIGAVFVILIVLLIIFRKHVIELAKKINNKKENEEEPA